MALYELVLQCTLWNQLCQNRFHYYRGPAGEYTDGSDDLVAAFMEDVFPAIAGVATDHVTGPDWNLIKARSLYEPTDFHEEVLGDLPGTALAGGEAMPPVLALAYRTERNRVGKNRGTKRFPGIGESHVSGGTYTETALSAALETALNATITDSVSGNAYHQRILYLDPTTVPPYGLYATEVLQFAESFRPAAWDERGVTTQRTRKIGVGI